MSGIFTNKPCSCTTAPLTEYAILVYDNQEESPSSFVNRYGAYPEDRLDSIPFKTKLGGVKESYRIKAFTIGEAFSYIAWIDDGSKEPQHRLLKFDEETNDFQEVHSCNFILKPKEATEAEKQAFFAEIRSRTKNLFGDLHA